MKQQRSFLFLDKDGKGQELSIFVDDSDSIDTVKAALKTKLKLTEDYVIEFPVISENQKNVPFNSLYRTITLITIAAKVTVKPAPLSAAADVKVEPVPVIIAPSKQVNPDIKIEAQPEVQADIWSFKNSRDDGSPYQDAHFTFAVDLNRPVGLRDDFAEQAVNAALRQTFKDLSKDIDELGDSADAGATLTVCAVTKLNVGIDSKEIKADAVPVTVVTAQLGDSAAHLITGTQAKLLAPIHRTTNQQEKTRVDAAVAEFNNHQPAAGDMLRPGHEEREEKAPDFSATSPTRTLGRAIDRDNFSLLDQPEIRVTHLSAQKASNAKICLTTDGVWESVTKSDLVDQTAAELCKTAVKNDSEDDLTVVKVSLDQVAAGKLIIMGMSDGNGKQGHVVTKHIADNFPDKFRVNLQKALTHANNQQAGFQLNKKPTTPAAAITTFVTALENLLQHCDKRLGDEHNHQGVQAIRDSLVKITAKQNNPWAQLEKLGKDISERHYGFWGTVRKYTTRDRLVEAMYSILKQLQQCNDPNLSVVRRLELLSEMTKSLQAAPKNIAAIENAQAYVYRPRSLRG